MQMKLNVSLKHLMLLGMFGALTGCASSGSSNFSCPSPNTGTCSPVHDVDKMVSSGQLGTDTATATGVSASATQSAGAFNNFSTPYPASIITPGAPLRVQEQVMAVWIAPFQDKQGNYHDAATLYTVIEPGQWAASPVTEVGNEEGNEGELATEDARHE